MKKLQVYIPLLLALTLIAGMWVGFSLSKNIPETQGFFSRAKRGSLQEAVDLIRKEYVDPVNTDSLSQDAITAMVNKLDPHSLYLPPVEAMEATDDLNGNFEGIGVEYQIIDDTVNVTNVLQDGPSDKAGMQVGDKIIRVEDSLVAGNNISGEKIKSLLRGPGQSAVNVRVWRNGKLQLLNITRGLIPTYSVDAAYLIADSTGFIHLNKFSQTTYEEFMAALENLQKKGLNTLILDLRGNGGGILDEAVDIADEFLSGDKLVVYTQGTHSPKREYRCKRPGLFETGRLILLLDEFSASASEVLAGALQDWDRATIVGRRSFGKGLVQEPFLLSNGGQLRLTVARYYTPAGRNIQKPFGNGREAYNDEIFERYHHRGDAEADTSANQGPAFTTLVKKRRVFGGGGITPDVNVAADTFSFSPGVSRLFYNQVFGQFIYRYFVTHSAYFGQFKTPADLARQFNPGPEAWDFLKNYARRDSIDLAGLTSRDQDGLNRRMKTWMARQIWRMEGYYEVNNPMDPVVQQALRLAKETP